jgi:hypothetical protein
MRRGKIAFERSRVRDCVLALAALVTTDALARAAPPVLRFVDPTPGPASLVAMEQTAIRIDAPCGVDPSTLAVSLDGLPLDVAALLPFGSCSGGRMLSRAAAIASSPPDGTIVAGPAFVRAGEPARFHGLAGGAELGWSFDGGAPPALGSPVEVAFRAAGRFVVRLRATTPRVLLARAALGSRVLEARRLFSVADPTPDEHAVEVEAPPDLDSSTSRRARCTSSRCPRTAGACTR